MADDEKSRWTKISITQPVDELLKHGPSFKLQARSLVGGGVVSALAQIDTGAAGSAISLRLAERLGLDPVGHGSVHQPVGPTLHAPYFGVSLQLPPPDGVRLAVNFEIEVVGLATLDPPHDVLIGRDILASCRLAVDFVGGTTSLHVRS